MLRTKILCGQIFLTVFFLVNSSDSEANTHTQNKKIDYCINNSQSSDFPTIDAEYYLPIEQGLLKIGGEVCINLYEKKISTQELFYSDKNQTIEIKTPLFFTDGKQNINAKSASVNLDQETAIINKAQYQILNSNANGVAEKMIADDTSTQLTGLTYSTCPIENQDWYIKAESADLNQETQTGVFRKMSLNFKGVPILYLPYAKIPLNDQRETGFLIPDIGNSSNNGFEIAAPYYINIKENMDATLTPRYFSKRGAMLGIEYRYLGKSYRGELLTDYLPSDRKDDANRRFLDFKHNHKLNGQWSVNSHITNVSDDNYFEDFGNSINDTSQAYLYSYLNVNGFSDNWLFKASINDYQILSESITLNAQPYQSLPSINYSWFNNSYTSSLNYGVDTSWSNLYREDSITASRLDTIPYIEKTFQNSYSRFTPKLAYRYTNWSYSDTQFSEIKALEESRSLPILTLDYSLSFEKQFEDGSLNTLEPRLFYLNVPYEEQQNIPLFDTHELTFGSGLLYQSNAFSGADRQSDANQLSIGLTQRHFNESGIEKWNFTVGQINYFEDRRVQLDDSIETANSSPIITELNYFYRNWRATMSVHWDTEIDKSERALLKFQHKGKNNSLFNFAYRFRRGKIEQLDSSVVLPIGTNNRIIARWNYSIDESKTIEAIAGYEHKNCCWATRLVARRYVINEQGDVNNGVFFELQFDGLGSLGRNPRRLLKQSILGYSEEF
ncbi:MAG: LPS-assembly protein LptD [Marinicellaceae bacterium]